MSIIGKKLGNAKKHNGQILEHNRHRLLCGLFIKISARQTFASYNTYVAIMADLRIL